MVVRGPSDLFDDGGAKAREREAIVRFDHAEHVGGQQRANARRAHERDGIHLVLDQLEPSDPVVPSIDDDLVRLPAGFPDELAAHFAQAEDRDRAVARLLLK